MRLKCAIYSKKLYKWLPIVMGCHCRPERTFQYKGKYFPVCARCTGEICGFLLAIASSKVIHVRWYILLLLLIPGIMDGIIQRYFGHESNNIRRFWTGTLLGYAIMYIFIQSAVAAFCWGYYLGLHIR